MSSEASEQTATAKAAEAAAAAGTGPPARKGEWKCAKGDSHVHKEELRKVWKECQYESFWYRALPLSVGSMAVTGGLIYKGVWTASKRFGYFPKLALAGILGFAVGKASYFGNCRRKFHELGIEGPPGPWSKGGPPGPWSRFGPGHRGCHHVCEECKKKGAPAPAAAATEEVKS